MRVRWVRVIAIVLVVAGVLLVAPGLARGDGPERPAPRVTYVVESGDTLWSIATRFEPSTDPRVVIDAIASANGVDPGALVPGQQLSIPPVG